MKNILFFLFSILILCSCGLSQKKALRTDANPITHEIWTDILSKHVNEEGWFDYAKLTEDRIQFDQYLRLLQHHHPNPDSWSMDERMAFWINAYNAFTVELILQNYPLKSIKDIKGGIPFVNGVWDIKFIEIEGRSYTLNNIEHGILRPKFEDPRIHMAINCASFSCPKLFPVAFEAAQLEDQLNEATRAFLMDENRNKVYEEVPKVSSIFKWFSGDFTKKQDQTLTDFINKYLDEPINPSTIEYLEYDWSLNDQAIQQ